MRKYICIGLLGSLSASLTDDVIHRAEDTEECSFCPDLLIVFHQKQCSPITFVVAFQVKASVSPSESWAVIVWCTGLWQDAILITQQGKSEVYYSCHVKSHSLAYVLYEKLPSEQQLIPLHLLSYQIYIFLSKYLDKMISTIPYSVQPTITLIMWTTNCSYLIPAFPSQESPLSRHRIPRYSSAGPLNPILQLLLLFLSLTLESFIHKP